MGRALDRTPTDATHRGWYVGSVALCALGLVVLGVQSTLLGAALAWSLTLLGLCAAGTVLTVAVTRRVPPGQRGTVSTGVAAANALGIVLGTALAASAAQDARAGGLLLAGAVVAACVPYAVGRPPRPLAPALALAVDPGVAEPVVEGSGRGSSRPLLAGLGVRGLLVLGNALGTTLLLFFFTYRLRMADAEDFLVQVVLVYVVATVLTAAVCGPLSDRWRARRRFLVASVALQGARRWPSRWSRTVRRSSWPGLFSASAGAPSWPSTRPSWRPWRPGPSARRRRSRCSGSRRRCRRTSVRSPRR